VGFNIKVKTVGNDLPVGR